MKLANTVHQGNKECDELNATLLQELKKHGGAFQLGEDFSFSTYAIKAIDKSVFPVEVALVDSVAELEVGTLGNGMEAVMITDCMPEVWSEDDTYILAAIAGNEISIDRVKDVIEML